MNYIYGGQYISTTTRLTNHFPDITYNQFRSMSREELKEYIEKHKNKICDKLYELIDEMKYGCELNTSDKVNRIGLNKKTNMEFYGEYYID